MSTVENEFTLFSRGIIEEEDFLGTDILESTTEDLDESTRVPPEDILASSTILSMRSSPFLVTGQDSCFLNVAPTAVLGLQTL